jgi:peptidyl-dipeptidase A
MKMLLTAMMFFAFAMVLKAQTVNNPTLADAEAFMKQAESRLAELSLVVNHASWVQSNFITFDTEALASDALDRNTALTTELVEQAKRFDGLLYHGGQRHRER